MPLHLVNPLIVEAEIRQEYKGMLDARVCRPRGALETPGGAERTSPESFLYVRPGGVTGCREAPAPSWHCSRTRY